MDSGFIVLNNRNYPGLNALFDELGVELYPTEMSFSLTGTPFSWCSQDFYQFRFISSFRKLKLLKEIVRFNRLAKREIENLSTTKWLDNNGFSSLFRDAYLYPMSAAIWSSRGQVIQQFPMRSLARFLNNHGLLDLFNRPQWFSLKGGSRTYINRVLETADINSLFLEEEVQVCRKEGQITVMSQNGSRYYDRVIFACHANEALEVLQEPTSGEVSALSKFAYSLNPTVVHFDEQLMPDNRNNWASWNAVNEAGYDYVTYWMNNLQDLETDHQVFVTIGEFPSIDSSKLLEEINYQHPIFTESTLKGQQELQALQGLNSTYYTGAHLGYGFHEDGLQSALRVVKDING